MPNASEAAGRQNWAKIYKRGRTLKKRSSSARACMCKQWVRTQRNQCCAVSMVINTIKPWESFCPWRGTNKSWPTSRAAGQRLESPPGNGVNVCTAVAARWRLSTRAFVSSTAVVLQSGLAQLSLTYEAGLTLGKETCITDTSSMCQAQSSRLINWPPTPSQSTTPAPLTVQLQRVSSILIKVFLDHCTRIIPCT